MTTELTLLSWTLVLALLQILATAMSRTRETGTDYNASARDQPSPVPTGKITGRLQRAQQNLFETLPLFVAAILVAHVAGRDGSPTFWGAWLYFIGRVMYVPLYVFGIPYVRSVIWLAGLMGLVMVLAAIVRPQ